MKYLILILLTAIRNEIKTELSDYQILTIANQNLTFNFDDQSDLITWSYRDLNSDEIIDTNSSIYNLHPFNFQHAGREIYLKDKKTNNILKVFHTIGIEDTCSVEIINKEVLTKDNNVSLVCSVKVKKKIGATIFGNISDDLRRSEDPIINWFVNESKNKSLMEIKGSLVNFTSIKKNKIEIFDSNRNIIKYSSEITLRLPTDDEQVWELNNRNIYCQVTHEGSYEIKSKVKLDFFPVSSIYCNNHLNINFNPYISQIVNRTQFIRENELSSLECPIKAPNFQPYKYSINWYYHSFDQINATWSFMYSKTFDKSGEFYIISNAKVDVDNGVYKCELIEIVSGTSVLSEVITVKFSELFPKNKATDIFATQFTELIINAAIVLVLIVIIIVLAIKCRLNKKTMRVDVSEEQQEINGDMSIGGNNQAVLKYELTNMQPNRDKLYDDVDDNVYKVNSYAVGDNQSIIKKLADLDTKNYIAHLASKLKHKKSCPMYCSKNNNNSKISYTETSISSARTLSNRSDSTLKPIVHKSVQFNLRESNETDYDGSEYMESIYIRGFKN